MLMIHMLHIIRIGVSHELQELIKVGISPLHPFLKQEVIILQLLKSTVNRVRCFYILRCPSIISDNHRLIPDSGLYSTHPNTLRTRKSHVTIGSMMEFIHIIITYESVNHFNSGMFYVDIFSTRGFDQ